MIMPTATTIMDMITTTSTTATLIMVTITMTMCITPAVGMTIPMTEVAARHLLLWLSPGYPVGSYAYSHGLEWAVEAGEVRDTHALQAWLAVIITAGAGRNDAVLAAAAHAALEQPAELASVAELAVALAPGRERQLETLQQGEAFWRTSLAAWPESRLAALPPEVTERLAYPVAVGLVAAAHGVSLAALLPALLLAQVANLVAAGVRLSVLGQTEAQALLARLLPLIEATAAEAATLTLDDLGGAAFRVDLAAMHHETQRTRLFRS
jgi:urease accessory protein